VGDSVGFAVGVAVGVGVVMRSHSAVTMMGMNGEKE
jgi:hypothetical protein